MAKQQIIILIEPFGTSDNRFKVFSDLSCDEIEGIEGVFGVSDSLYDEGYLIVTIDKRWRINEVLEEIDQMAMVKHNV